MKNQSQLHFLFLLIISSSCVLSQRVSYHKCKLSAESIEVTYNSDTKEIELFDANFYNNTTNTGTAVPQTYDAKYCECADDPHNEEQRYYCLIQNDENSCSVPSLWTQRIQEQKRLTHVSCYKSSFMDKFIKASWMPVFFFNLLLLSVFFTTRFGFMARTYVLSKCFPCINRRVVEKELARERAMRRELREMMTRSRESPDGRLQKLSLHLKTKSFVEKGKEEDFEEDVGEDISSKESYDTHQTTCSICMIDIINGDRIGDLECGHEFHIDCLKNWVLWRNTCPLCNASDIAITKVTHVPKQE